MNNLEKGVERLLAELTNKVEKEKDVAAGYDLGNLYCILKEYKEAVKYLTWAARRNTEAKYKLGICYEKGRGVAPDKFQAARYYNGPALTSGFAAYRLSKLFHHLTLSTNAEDQYSLAYVYKKGLDSIGIEKNNSATLSLLELAADQDYAPAQIALGKRSGGEAAFRLFTSAARKGQQDAHYELGMIHYYKAEYEKAIEHLKLVDSPSKDSKFWFGLHLKELKAHAELIPLTGFTEKQKMEFAESAYFLGCLYNVGLENFGVQLNGQEALRLFELADKHRLAKPEREKIYERFNLRFMYHPPQKENIGSNDIIVFSENDIIYYQFSCTDRLKIDRDKFEENYDAILESLEGPVIMDVDRYRVALQQTEEGQHKLADHNYALAIRHRTLNNNPEIYRNKLLKFILLDGHVR